MHKTYRKATIGNHEKGYRECVIEEEWPTRASRWLARLRERWTLWEFDHKEVATDDTHWWFRESWLSRRLSRLIYRIVGKHDPISTKVYRADEVKESIL